MFKACFYYFCIFYQKKAFQKLWNTLFISSEKLFALNISKFLEFFSFLFTSGLDKLCLWWWPCKQCGSKEIFECSKLCACKSIKTPLSSTPILFKVMSYFCVWKQIIFGTIRSTFIISFSWEATFKYNCILCTTCEKCEQQLKFIFPVGIYLFKVNNENTRKQWNSSKINRKDTKMVSIDMNTKLVDVALVSFDLTLNIFCLFFYCFLW